MKVRTTLVQRADIDAYGASDLAQQVGEALHDRSEGGCFGGLEVGRITKVPPGLEDQPTSYGWRARNGAHQPCVVFKQNALAAYGDNPPLDERLRRTLEQTPGDELFTAAIRNHFSALESLTRNVSPEAFQAAVAILAACDRVVWRGVGPSAHLAAYGQLITQRMGKRTAADEGAP